MEPEKLKVVELREELAARGLSTKGLKAELVARLQEYLADNPSEPQTDERQSEVEQETKKQEPASSPKKTRGSPKKTKAEASPAEEIVEAAPPPNVEEESEADLSAEQPEQKRAKTDSEPSEEAILAPEPLQTEQPEEQATESAFNAAPTNPPSTVIHITNLHRPFHEKQLKEFIGNGFVGFWLNNIKSECLVRFETVEAAEACRRHLFNKQFPPELNHIVQVDFSTEAKFAEVHAPEEMMDEMVEVKEPEMPLTNFFKKTTVEPAIYYLPKEE